MNVDNRKRKKTYGTRTIRHGALNVRTSTPNSYHYCRRDDNKGLIYCCRSRYRPSLDITDSSYNNCGPSLRNKYALLSKKCGRISAKLATAYYPRCEKAFNANPWATEVNSWPARNLAPPKRFSKILLTAGTKDEPPVKKTASTSR